jgi:hypothetical protein
MKALIAGDRMTSPLYRALSRPTFTPSHSAIAPAPHRNSGMEAGSAIAGPTVQMVPMAKRVFKNTN